MNTKNQGEKWPRSWPDRRTLDFRLRLIHNPAWNPSFALTGTHRGRRSRGTHICDGRLPQAFTRKGSR